MRAREAAVGAKRPEPDVRGCEPGVLGRVVVDEGVFGLLSEEGVFGREGAEVLAADGRGFVEVDVDMDVDAGVRVARAASGVDVDVEWAGVCACCAPWCDVGGDFACGRAVFAGVAAGVRAPGAAFGLAAACVVRVAGAAG